jgi:site-specific DNA recombinase
MTKQAAPRTVKDMRLVGVIRLSKDDDDTTNPERHRLKIEDYTEREGHRIVGWAEDLDVSGSVSVWDRPELGPWMKKDDQWDGLIVAKLDRVSRSVLDFATLVEWLQKRGKVLICLSPAIDLSTPQGRAFAGVAMVFAQLEREMTGERVADAYRHIRTNGGYPGGQVPFGYVAVKRDGKGWGYEHDPEYAPIVRQMVARILDGDSMRAVAQWLNRTGIPTPFNVTRRRNGKPERPSQWTSANVKKVLLSPAICGLQAEGGKPMRDGDGYAVIRCDGIITRQEWEAVKRATTGPEHKTYRTDANPLLGVGFCFLCGSQLYTSKVSSRGSTWNYYRCSKGDKDSTCEAMMLPADWLNDQAAEIFLAQCGDLEWGRWDTTPAENHEYELTTVKQELADLDDEYAAGTLHAATYARMTKRLEERLEALSAAPVASQEPVWVGTGETYEQRWRRLSKAQRGRDMRHAGFRLYVAKRPEGLSMGVQVHEYVIEDGQVRERVNL